MTGHKIMEMLLNRKTWVELNAPDGLEIPAVKAQHRLSNELHLWWTWEIIPTTGTKEDIKSHIYEEYEVSWILDDVFEKDIEILKETYKSIAPVLNKRTKKDIEYYINCFEEVYKGEI